MNKVLQTLANDLITSLRYLEKPKASTVTQEREKALQTLLKIFEMKMDLNKKIIDGIFFACLNLLAEKELIESELMLLLQVQLKLFENYSGKDYFLGKTNENNNLIAFLVKLSLPHLTSEAKEIASITSLLLIEIAKYIDIQMLKNIYPSLCSSFLKVILDFNPKTSKKCLIHAVDFLLFSFEKIFSDSKYKSVKNIVSLDKKVHDLTLSLFKGPAQDNKNGPSQLSERDEDLFYQEARKILNSFLSVLSEKAYKLPKSAELTQKFLNLFDFILNKSIKFFQLQEKANFMRVFNCLLYFLALADSDTSQKYTLEALKLYPSLKYEIKSSQLKLIKNIPKLLKEVETKYFISHFKRLNVGFEILNTQDFINYTSSEVSDMLKVLQIAFHLTFKGQIIVNDNSVEIDYENLKNKLLTQDYMTESFHQYNSAFTRFILEYLPISNFDEEVFRTSRKMFSLIKGSLAINLVENLYSSLIENKFSNTEEVLTLIFLLSLLLEHSQENGIQTTSILEFFIDNPLKNIDFPKTLKAKEQKLLIDQLTTTIVYFSYQRLQVKSPILTSRVLIFLFGRFHQDHRLQRFLVWNCLIKISKASFDEVRTFESFIKFYSETLIRNFIDKLKMIHLLYDPELPFNLLKAFIWFSDSESFLKYAENLISHLNRHFDKFYLREDFRTIKLIFPLYKTIFEAIDTEFTRNTENAQKILKNSNLMRRALLRIKPFILENDRHLCHFSIEILKISCFALSCLPMEREQANENFSPDDPENVVISESLGPIAWEFFGTIAFRLKKKGHPATILECLQYLRAIQKYNKQFLVNERRFETHIFPAIQSYLFSAKKEYYNNLDLRILEVFCSIIIDLGLTDQEANKQFINQIRTIINEAHKVLEKVEDNNMNEQLREKIDNLNKLFGK